MHQPIRRFVTLATLLAALFATLLARAGYATARKNLVFATIGAHNLRLDVYYPRTPPPAGGYPLIISIHGGGWIFGNRHKDLFLRDLTTHGYAFASIDYRLSGEAKFPAQIDDTRKALDWLIANAGPLQLNPERIGVTGASAGAHLALLLGLHQSGHSNPIKAICALYPPTDLISIIPPENRTRRDNLVAALLGGSVSEHIEIARVGSPITYVSKDAPPVLLIHGDKDTLVPIEQSKTLNAALRRAGADSSLTIYQGKGHGFSLRPDMVAEVAKFFDRHVKD